MNEFVVYEVSNHSSIVSMSFDDLELAVCFVASCKACSVSVGGPASFAAPEGAAHAFDSHNLPHD